MIPRLRLVGHYADFFFHFDGIHHNNCIPGTAVEERSVGAFAGALFAADAEDGVDLDSPEGRVIFVRDPEHAVLDRAILHAGGRAGAAGAALGNDRKFFGFLFANGGEALGPGFVLELVGNHPGLFGVGFGCHRMNYTVSHRAL